MGCTGSTINHVYPTQNYRNTKTSHTKNFILGIINPQNDFFQSGSLAIANSNEIIGPINKLRYIISDKINTFISMDSHPFDHFSFASTHNKEPYTTITNDIVESEQILWPIHCVSDTCGFQIHPHLIIKPRDWKIMKGTLKNIESYSAFGDEFWNIYEKTRLYNLLKKLKHTDIILVGLTMDYSIYYTTLDALRYEYQVHIILSCTRGVDENTTLNAIKHLKSLSGIHFYHDIEDFLFMHNMLI